MDENNDNKLRSLEIQQQSNRIYRCSWGTCNSDSRYYYKRDDMKNIYFIPFPKPKRKKEKCLVWIRACNRPNHQLNVEKINKDKYVCSQIVEPLIKTILKLL